MKFCSQVDPGVRPYHGLLCLLRWADAQYIIGDRHFWLVCHPLYRSTLQATLLQYLAREHSWATRAPHHNHDIRSSERLFPPTQVGRVPHLLLYGDHDDQCCRGGAWTRLEGSRGSMCSSFIVFIAFDAGAEC